MIMNLIKITSFIYINIKNAEFVDATIVKVPEVVNVWIVCPQLVVIVPPVELGETQSLQFVA